MSAVNPHAQAPGDVGHDEALRFGHTELPPDVVQGTSERYREAYRLLTGQEVV